MADEDDILSLGVLGCSKMGLISIQLEVAVVILRDRENLERDEKPRSFLTQSTALVTADKASANSLLSKLVDKAVSNTD